MSAENLSEQAEGSRALALAVINQVKQDIYFIGRGAGSIPPEIFTTQDELERWTRTKTFRLWCNLALLEPEAVKKELLDTWQKHVVEKHKKPRKMRGKNVN